MVSSCLPGERIVDGRIQGAETQLDSPRFPKKKTFYSLCSPYSIIFPSSPLNLGRWGLVRFMCIFSPSAFLNLILYFFSNFLFIFGFWGQLIPNASCLLANTIGSVHGFFVSTNWGPLLLGRDFRAFVPKLLADYLGEGSWETTFGGSTHVRSLLHYPLVRAWDSR